METEHVAGPIWRVHSESGSKWYVVDLDVPNCTCTDWSTKRNKRVHDGLSDFYKCKHVFAAETEADQIAVDTEIEEKVDQAVEGIKARFRKS